MEQLTTNALLKLIALIIHKQGGVIKLDAADLFDEAAPKGFSKRWDNVAKQMILSVVEQGTAIHIAEDKPWTSGQQNQPLNMDAAKQQMDKLIADAYGQPSETRHVILDEERVAMLDKRRREQAALKEIVEFRSPEPVSRTPRSTASSTQPSNPMEAFFRSSATGS
jgi:hypothetical protein